MKRALAKRNYFLFAVCRSNISAVIHLLVMVEAEAMYWLNAFSLLEYPKSLGSRLDERLSERCACLWYKCIRRASKITVSMLLNGAWAWQFYGDKMTIKLYVFALVCVCASIQLQPTITILEWVDKCKHSLIYRGQ